MIINVDINNTLESLLKQEDTDFDKKITSEDTGPKSFLLKDRLSGNEQRIEGTYHLSNLLQELVLASESGLSELRLDRIVESPIQRFKRMIEEFYWDGLTRTIDEAGLEKVLADEKSAASLQRIYVPYEDKQALEYYTNLKAKFSNLEVIRLPATISPEFVQSINDRPGLLALKLVESENGLSGTPFVVPGGRFNEMYGWDSYFESIGLLLGPKKHLAKAMADNFQYEIEHYGKILNANRSYYLTRTQPPFYSSLIREVYEAKVEGATLDWLALHLHTAIKEYHSVWMVEGKRLTSNGLNRYLAEGIGLPPEVEPGHYDAVLKPFAEKENMSVAEYEKAYYQRTIKNPELDQYFIHDRSVRENGHDTSYRLEGICAHLNCVELNVFLYKYECDFAHLINHYFGDSFRYGNEVYTSEFWLEKAAKRRDLMDRYLWNENDHCYYDYNMETMQQFPFVAASSLLPLWAGIPSKEQAKKMVVEVLPSLTCLGGIAGCTLEARGDLSEDRPARQWDYPNGWAPHQMMLWKGLLAYGFNDEAYEVMYRWLWMITKNAMHYNGTIPEKYDVVTATHMVFAEYGNVGTEFEYITREGFGWMNASYLYGLSLLPDTLKEKLNSLEHPDILFN